MNAQSSFILSAQQVAMEVLAPADMAGATLQKLDEARKILMAAIEWLSSLAEGTDSTPNTQYAASAALDIYCKCPWDLKLKNFAGAMTFLQLQSIFGESYKLSQGVPSNLMILDKSFAADSGKKWADDNILDAGCQAICRAACWQRQQDGHHADCKVFCVRTMAMQYLVNPQTHKTNTDQALEMLQDFTWLKCLKAELHQSSNAVVYFPMTIMNRHWIVGRFDLVSWTWTFADSLFWTDIPLVYYMACKTFSECLGFKSTESSRPTPNILFKSGHQMDSHLCGYFALNAIESDVFGSPLASPATARLCRVKTFLRIYHEHLQDHSSVLSSKGDKGVTRTLIVYQLDQFPSRGNQDLEQALREIRTLRSQVLSEEMDCSDIDSTHDMSGSSESDDEAMVVEEVPECSDSQIKQRYKSWRTESEPTLKRMTKSSWRAKDAVELKDKPHLWERFEKKVKEIDSDAKLNPKSHPRHVWCLLCTKWIPLKVVFQVSCFAKHHSGCVKGRKLGASGKQSDLKSFFTPAKRSDQEVPAVCLTCPGLTEAFDPRIVNYLERTGAEGGGAPRYSVLKERALAEFRRKRSSKIASNTGKLQSLSKSELAKKIRLVEESLFKWINHRTMKLVKAKNCLGTTSSKNLPCKLCWSL